MPPSDHTDYHDYLDLGGWQPIGQNGFFSDDDGLRMLVTINTHSADGGRVLHLSFSYHNHRPSAKRLNQALVQLAPDRTFIRLDSVGRNIAVAHYLSRLEER